MKMLSLLTEAGYGRVLSFHYPPFRVDERPKVLFLNRFVHKNTRNELIEGINLNYLSAEQLERLRAALPEILATSWDSRFEVVRKLLPDIYKSAFRRYRESEIHVISPSTLKKLPSEKAREKAEKSRKWREMSPDERFVAQQDWGRKSAAARKAKLSSVQRRIEPEVPPEVPPEVKGVSEVPEVPEAPEAPPEVKEVPEVPPESTEKRTQPKLTKNEWKYGQSS